MPDMRKFSDAAALRRADGSGRGLQPASPPDLPRGRGAAAIMRTVPRWALLLAGLALVPSACGSGSGKTATTPPPPKRAATPTPTSPPAPDRKLASAGDAAVVRGWADALREGHLERAVRYFAIPSVVSNGTKPIKLSSRDDVRFFNRTLPCGAQVMRVEDSGAYVIARFILTERPGKGQCGSGVGGQASAAFLIRRHHIVQWRRVVEPAPDATPAGPQTDA